MDKKTRKDNTASTYTLRRVNMEEFSLAPWRFKLRSGGEDQAPSCPYGNTYQWIGYDLLDSEYVRFSKSVFKKLIANNGQK